ncbi:unnamed protein product, partial [marine sediment metagenome]
MSSATITGSTIAGLADTSIAGWSMAGHTTFIDGGDIYTDTITATQIDAGTITGTEISASAIITAGTGNNVGVLDGNDAAWRIYAGHATPASAPFRVNQAGKCYATEFEDTLGNAV